MEQILIPLILAGLLAVIPGWRMYQFAYFTCEKSRIILVLMCLVVPFLLAAPAFWIPFLFSKGKEVDATKTLFDLLMYGAAPLGLIALLAYVADHFSESSFRKLVSGAACFAVAMLPIAYYFRAEQMHTQMEITVSDQPPDFSRFFRLR